MSPRKVTAAPRPRSMRDPDSLIITSPNLEEPLARRLATLATQIAKVQAPKATGAGAASLEPYWGQDFFGLSWGEDYMWAQERGMNPFTMTSLAGKTIPMWVLDPDGSQEAALPAKDRTPERIRRRVDGRTEVLIFRKVAPIGARKNVNRGGRVVSVPASYPGAPGRPRITSPAGMLIRPGGGGVRWRHPGMAGKGFMEQALTAVAQEAGLGTPPIRPFRRAER